MDDPRTRMKWACGPVVASLSKTGRTIPFDQFVTGIEMNQTSMFIALGKLENLRINREHRNSIYHGERTPRRRASMASW